MGGPSSIPRASPARGARSRRWIDATHLYFAKESAGSLDAVRAAVALEGSPGGRGIGMPGRYLRRAGGKWEERETLEPHAPDAGRP
jgi:hypothetical protein